MAGNMDGWDVAEVAREIDSDRRPTADQWAIQGAKPFAPAQLVTGISNLLDAGGEPLAAGAEARR
jgi:hypothetical protein